MNTYQITKRKLTKQPNKNLPNNQIVIKFFVHLRNGSYGLIEIKLGGDSLIQEGADALIDLKDKIDTTKMKKPSFLMVLTAVGQYAYKRPKDGVLVVPIGCLKD